MGRDRTARIMTSPAEMRAAARRGEWRSSTGGQCPAHQQANLVILPQEAAVEFAAFCTRNPKPCDLDKISTFHACSLAKLSASLLCRGLQQAWNIRTAISILDRTRRTKKPGPQAGTGRFVRLKARISRGCASGS